MMLRDIDTVVRSRFFDHRYYLLNLSINRMIAAVNYLADKDLRRRKPHPFFDHMFYAVTNKDVANSSYEPLVHYIKYGAREGRAPHPLFDPAFYLRSNPDVAADGIDPLSHFITHGFLEGRAPSEGVDIKRYLSTQTRLSDLSMDMDRLINWHEQSCQAEISLHSKFRDSLIPEPLSKDELKIQRASSKPVSVHCVYGPNHVEHIENVLIPALHKSSFRKIELHTFPYKMDVKNVSYDSKESDRVTVINHPNHIGHVGFAESHNHIFELCDHNDYFIMMNPDCIPQPNCIDHLIERFLSTGCNCGIVEGRQWPFEHPKEFDPRTGETPWASGAFCLVNADMYRTVGGMDQSYFLYLEDVDLSWQSWLKGYAVLYERRAVITHFSGGRFYRDDLVEAEKFYSLRNFIYISAKYFGEEGKNRALSLLAEFGDKKIVEDAIKDYNKNMRAVDLDNNASSFHPKIQIYGIGQFHRMNVR